MKVSFDGIGEVVATFEAAAGIAAGDCVKMSANGKVAKCASGDRFCGIAADPSADGLTAVRVHGFCTAKYTGTAPTVGYGRLVSDGAGAVKTDSGTTGGEYLITKVDSATATVCFWM